MKLGLFFIVIVLGNPVFAQNKIGIADTLFLLDELPSRDSTHEMIKEKKAEYTKELNVMDSILARKKELYAANKSQWSPLIVKTFEVQIADLQNKIQEFKVQTNEDILRLNKDCDDRSSEILHQAIEKVSADLKLKAVWDKSQALSSDDEIDVTDRVRTEMLRIDHL